ncbi:MAG: hypothetical protein K2X72_15965 [Reyranella sp.]|nr:hypothetical protein [Reyranella sp.]
MNPRIASCLFLCLSAALAIAVPAMAQDEYVDTPFGKVPKECYRQHPAGTTLSQITNGVRARHADGTTRDYVSSEKCLAFGRTFKPNRLKSAMAPPVSEHWFDLAGWQAPQQVGQFTATYTLPGLPASQGAQKLDYYIGLQDTDSLPAAILQPVLEYLNGVYSLSSWNCCPSGQVNQGNIVTGMQPGDTISASIMQTQQSPPTYAINGVWKGQTADLTVDVGSENFVLTFVGLETYYVAACDQFLIGQFVFSPLYMANVNNQELIPTWGVNPANGTSCNNQVTVNGPGITIELNGSSSQRR